MTNRLKIRNENAALPKLKMKKHRDVTDNSRHIRQKALRQYR